ncbi:MAG: hypothetical protein ABSH53_23385 [Holophaga sp.]|jgi:hypothetical protein
MKSRLLPILALLAAMPAAAEDNWQAGLGLNFQDSTQLSAAEMNFSHGRRVTSSILAGYRALDFGTSDLSFTGEYQFRNQFDLGSNRVGPVRGDLTFRKERIAPGVQWNFHQTGELDWGLDLQMRFTTFKASNGVAASRNAPWLGAHARYTFQHAAGVKPFVGFRVARAMTAVPAAPTAQDSVSDATMKAMRRMDGMWDASLQAGVRF